MLFSVSGYKIADTSAATDKKNRPELQDEPGRAGYRRDLPLQAIEQSKGYFSHSERSEESLF
jgi:hypothetical protein